MMSIHIRIITSLMAGLALLAAVTSHAADVAPVSPAVQQYPARLLAELRECKNDSWFSPSGTAASHAPLDYVQAWFDKFRAFNSATVLPSEHAYGSPLRGNALGRADVQRVRRLADYQTVQALAALMDTMIRASDQYRRCSNLGARLVLRIAAQRDRAWVWADAMSRILSMDRMRWQTELQRRQLRRALQRLERSYRLLEPSS